MSNITTIADLTPDPKNARALRLPSRLPALPTASGYRGCFGAAADRAVEMRLAVLVFLIGAAVAAKFRLLSLLLSTPAQVIYVRVVMAVKSKGALLRGSLSDFSPITRG